MLVRPLVRWVVHRDDTELDRFAGVTTRDLARGRRLAQTWIDLTIRNTGPRDPRAAPLDSRWRPDGVVRVRAGVSGGGAGAGGARISTDQAAGAVRGAGGGRPGGREAEAHAGEDTLS